MGFDPEDVFDWTVLEDGPAGGGFTICVTRDRLKTVKEKLEYDDYVGISCYEKI